MKGSRILTEKTFESRAGMNGKSGLKSIAGLLLTAAGLLFLAIRNYPAIYGDEYRSLQYSEDLGLDWHAIGYFFQLKIWRFFAETDFWLRLFSALWAEALIVCAYFFMKAAGFSEKHRCFFCLFLMTNSLFLQYGVQVRPYSLFMTASFFFYFRLYQYLKLSSRRNFLWLLAAIPLLVTAHLFAWKVVLIGFLTVIWLKAPEKLRWVFPVFFLLGSLLFLNTSFRSAVVRFVYSAANTAASLPVSDFRGWDAATLWKTPFTFYTFSFGEYVYPLWLGITIPAFVAISIFFIRGFLEISKDKILFSIVVFSFMSALVLYLIVDPLPPRTLQGAAPRYVIYIFPIYSLVIFLGAYKRKGMLLALFLINFITMAFFLKSDWSCGAVDLMDWPRHLNASIAEPSQTCVINDYDASLSLGRYLPEEIKRTIDPEGCLNYPRVLLITNNESVELIRQFDKGSAALLSTHDVIDSIRQFPAQITVFKKRTSLKTVDQVPPARLSLIEQDMPLPLRTTEGAEMGFVRLDAEQKTYTASLSRKTESLNVIGAYRSNETISAGTPVLKLVWQDQAGRSREEILRAGIEICSWVDERCERAEEAGHWIKRFHLVGKQTYPEAHRQFKARIWRSPIKIQEPAQNIEATSLLEEGTFYLFALNPDTAGRTRERQDLK